MSLCRYLPTPSERMGIIWSLLSVEGSLLLEYGPAGTTHYSMGLYGSLGLNFQQRIFSTHMSEDDVVMGDVTRLEKAIVELDVGYAPRVIFVVASLVATVIGADLKGVCRYMQKDVKAKLVALECTGFQGDYSAGIGEVYQLLVKELVETAATKVAGTFNVLGASKGSYRMTSDLWEIENLLREGFGLTLHTCLCVATSVEKIAQMGSAEVNLVLRPEALAAGELLLEKTQTPFVVGAPYGYAGTLTWLRTIEKQLGRPLHPGLVARLEAKQRMLLPIMGMRAMRKKRFEPTAVVEGEYIAVCGISAILAGRGIERITKISKHSLKNIPDAPEDIIHYKEEKARLKVLQAAQHALVIGSDITLFACNDTNRKVLLSFPRLEGRSVAEHLPFMGEKGADYLVEEIEGYLESL